MTPEENEVSIALLQVLYVNRDRAPGFMAERIANALEFKLEDVNMTIRELSEKGFVEQVHEGYRITDRGYNMVYQRETSYCPHL